VIGAGFGRTGTMSLKVALEELGFGPCYHMSEVFERWNEEVKRRVPDERLLVYEVKEGWEPLCDFLGVAVPDGEPFPHLNDAETFRKMLRRRRALASAAFVGGVSLIGLALLYLLSRTSPRRA
jgi:Sulfotransferase domain